MKTNYIRWNREMERKCLGRALQEYNQNNVSAKKIQNVSHKAEKSEITTEAIQKNTPENTDNTNLQTSMKDIVKENEIHKSYTNKIHWNEDMLKRCLGTCFNHASNSKEPDKCVNEAKSGGDESNEITHEDASQEEILHEIHYEVLNNEDKNENEQVNMDNYKKISWTIISENDDNGDNEDNEDNDETAEYKKNEDIDEKVENEEREEKEEKEEKEEREEIDENDFKEDQNKQEDYKNDYQDDYENDYEDIYNYDNLYINGFKDSYAAEDVQEDSFYDEYDEGNEPEQYLNEAFGNDFELDYENNSLEAFELEITDRTKNGMDWVDGWDEYNLIDIESRNIEIPEYIDDYDQIGYGQSVECRIIT